MDLFRNMASIAMGEKPLVQPMFNSFSRYEGKKNDGDIEYNDEIVSQNRPVSISQEGIQAGSPTGLKPKDKESQDKIGLTTDILILKVPEHGEKISSEENDDKDITGSFPLNQIKNIKTGENNLVLGLEERILINDNIKFDANKYEDDIQLNDMGSEITYTDNINVDNRSLETAEQGKINEKIKKQETGHKKFINTETVETLIKIPGETISAQINEENEQVLGLESMEPVDKKNLNENNKLHKSKVFNTENSGSYNSSNNLNINYDRSLNKNEKRPSVHITIGRIEVKAVTPQQKSVQKKEQKKPQLSLNDYLRSLNGDKR